ncbi:MAG TPA: heparinase II/III family protein [Puia sp.]|nr:heparinase II/III family protein [Puia sp.]
MRTYTISAVLALTLCITDVKAQVIQRNLLQSFVPGLSSTLVSRDAWKPFPQTSDGWRQFLPDSTVQKAIRGGESALHYEFKPIPATLALEFKRNGNRSRYEHVSFEKRNVLCGLVFAEVLEGKGRFTDKILDGIWSVCEETYWGVSAHVGLQKAGSGLPDAEDPTVDLFTAETAAMLAWVDYFIGPELEKISPLIRQRIYYEVNRRVFVPLKTAKYGYLGGGRSDAKLNNWAPWVMSNYLAAALLLEKDEAKRVDAVGRAMHFTDQYINGLGEDGGCDEGPSYWGAAGGCVFDVLDLLSSASQGKINIYQSPIIRKMGAYIYKTHIAGKYYINVSDSPPQLVPDGLMIFRAGQAMQDTAMMGFGSWVCHEYPNGWGSMEGFHRSRALFDLGTIKGCLNYPPRDPQIKDCWFEDVQLMASRTDKGLFAASHGGHNAESHNHNDVGDFIVYAGGQPVIIDVGSGTYTARTFSSHRYDLWFNTSAYHNLPLINGFQQKEGRQYAAEAVQYQTSKGSSSLTMNIAKAYPAGAGIRSWIRTVRVYKKAGVTVSDNYALDKPLESLTQTFMTVCQVDLTQRGRIVFETDTHEKVRLDYDDAFWDASVEKVDLVNPEDEGIRQRWDGRAIYRVLLKAVKLPAQHTVQYTIRPVDVER